MNNIYYKTDEPLKHLDNTKKHKSLIWKIMYKRVKSKMNKDLINPLNLKKIIFNRYFVNGLTYNSPLPKVLIHRTASWYLNDDENEYYFPLSIAFTNDKVRFDIVLIDGDIDLRVVEINEKKSVLNHKPMLLIKNLEVLEFCFDLLLNHLEEFEKGLKDK